MPNIVYVLTNALMPGLVKIGWTNGNVEARLKELSAVPGVPLPFQCHFAAEVDDAARTEKVLHELFSEYRVNPRREFFRIDAEKVVLAISIGRFTEVTPGAAEVDEQEKEAVEKEMARRPKLRLDAIGIRPGDTLKFSRDESVTAIVLENGKVQLDGEVLTWPPQLLRFSTRWDTNGRLPAALNTGCMTGNSWMSGGVAWRTRVTVHTLGSSEGAGAKKGKSLICAFLRPTIDEGLG